MSRAVLTVCEAFHAATVPSCSISRYGVSALISCVLIHSRTVEQMQFQVIAFPQKSVLLSEAHCSAAHSHKPRADSSVKRDAGAPRRRATRLQSRCALASHPSNCEKLSPARAYAEAFKTHCARVPPWRARAQLSGKRGPATRPIGAADGRDSSEPVGND